MAAMEFADMLALDEAEGWPYRDDEPKHPYAAERDWLMRPVRRGRYADRDEFLRHTRAYYTTGS